MIWRAGRLILWEEWSLGLATNFIPKSVFTDAMVRGGQQLLGWLPVRHLFWTDCAGGEVADTWQKARPDDSTVIDVAAMMKAHSCQQRSLDNVRAPPNLDDGILLAKCTEDSLYLRIIPSMCYTLLY